MCGITGFILGSPMHEPATVLAEMTSLLTHRGPDGHGYWHDESKRVAFGHRRLAIVDLSSAGKQPMLSATRRYAITFNGEVYNFRILREQLQAAGHTFRGGSDTEVVLACFEEWGICRSIDKFIGMFAMAVWDDEEQTLYLIRDRFGKKPLYYSQVGPNIVFASELKSIRVFPGFDDTIQRESVALYLRHNYVPAPESIYASVRKVPPATIVKFDCRQMPRLVEERRYWDPWWFARSSGKEPYRGSFEDAVREFEELLRDAVRLRMIADVPLGAFLSGGIDSSLVVSFMTCENTSPVRTFTIGFDDASFDEAKHARQVARHLQTDHTELYVTGDEAMRVIPSLPTIYDEPFADSSQIPTFLVSRLARAHVTVSLSGDGGDELAAGYDRYLWMKTIWRTVRVIPKGVRNVLADILRWHGTTSLLAMLRVLPQGAAVTLSASRIGSRLIKLAEALTASGPDGIYRQLISHWTSPEDVVLGVTTPPRDITGAISPAGEDELLESLMITDATNYLSDDILVKVDRASMANSLEVRAPLLDHRLFEFCRSLPVSFHVRGKQGKQILRAVLAKYVPTELVDRPKMGFGIPLGAWLRGPLREWAEALLSFDRLHRDGIFDPVPIRKLWTEFLAGRNESHYLLWDVLMFQAWFDAQTPVKKVADRASYLSACN